MADLASHLTHAKALIFDCDGTLVDTPAVYAQAWQEAFAEAGHAMDLDWYHERAGMSEHVLLEAFERLKGVSLDHERAVQTMRRSVLKGMESVTELSTVAAIARQCHGLKPMAVASGGPEIVVLASLKSTGLLPLFDTVVALDAVGIAKPEPDLFFEAARRLQVSPGDCLVFEDSEQGFEAAQRAGMPVIDVHALPERESVAT